jgi:hypothetical protein
MNIRSELEKHYIKIEENLFSSREEGYWSNLSKNESRSLVSSLTNIKTRDAINKFYPSLFDIIFSPKREAGLELLNLSGHEYCVDYGCMWGALTIPLAKRCDYVLGIDQTMDSLRFLKIRAKEEELYNIDLLCTNIKKINIFQNKFDIAIVNGVLEWIPEDGSIELKTYFGKFKRKKYKTSPIHQQVDFLNKLRENLSENGKLYLAIENRFDYKMFLGCRDPHTNLLFVSILPRKVSDFISLIVLGRPYVNWLYSFGGIKALLEESGFSKIQLYMCFPDYRFPEHIIPFSGNFENFNPSIHLWNSDNSSENMTKKYLKYIKRIVSKIAQILIFKTLKLKIFASSIIAIAQK